MLQCQTLHIAYGKHVIVKELNLHIVQPQLVLLAGANGAGKSSLIKAFCGLNAFKGRIQINQQVVNAQKPALLAGHVSYMPSMPPQACYLSVAEMVNTSKLNKGSLWNGQSKNAADFLREVGMEAYQNHVFESLSDGEKQKVMLARALAQQAPVMLLDEPMAFLDYPSKIELLHMLKKLCQVHHKLIIFSSHDMEVSMSAAQRLLLLKNGEIRNMEPAEFMEIKPKDLF